MDETRAAGIAALSICESLLLSLEDRGVIDARERAGLLEDVARTHQAAAADEINPELNEAVAALANELRQGRSAVRALRPAYPRRSLSGRPLRRARR